jgi:hypothetical protein
MFFAMLKLALDKRSGNAAKTVNRSAEKRLVVAHSEMLPALLFSEGASALMTTSILK